MHRESRGHDKTTLTTRSVAGGNGVTPGTPGFSCAVCIGRTGRGERCLAHHHALIIL
jgi:hypothetical protein